MNKQSKPNGENAKTIGLGAHSGEVDKFVAQVGANVRSVRKSKGLTRKALSELSGISERYLAQLEGGAGNISIALLFKVSHALNFPLAGLLAADGVSDGELQRIFELFQAADASQREEAVAALGGSLSVKGKANRICLIGLRGAGKSTLGKLLSMDLGLPFIELNKEIEAQSGIAVDEVIALYGQEGYRRLERQALQRIVANNSEVVLAAAGGIVSEPDTYSYMLGNFHTIWLKAEPEEHMARVKGQGDERPMAGNPRAMDALKSILLSRTEQYARAEAMVDTSGRRLEESRQDLIACAKNLVSKPQE